MFYFSGNYYFIKILVILNLIFVNKNQFFIIYLNNILKLKSKYINYFI